MINEYLLQGIKKIKPSAEFSFVNNNYETIVWNSLEGLPPTEEEILVAIEEVKIEITQKELNALQAKNAAQDKLSALGFTTDDLKALGLQVEHLTEIVTN